MLAQCRFGYLPHVSSWKKEWWLRGTAVFLLLITLITLRQPIWALLQIVGNRAAVIAYLEQFGLAGPIVLGTVLVLQVIVAAIPGHILMIGGAYVYGFPTAFCINLLATVGGSQAAFWLAQWAGRPVIERLAPPEVLDKWQAASTRKGTLFFMFAFMLPIFPADVMNYVAGLSGLTSRQFFVANLVGRLPGLVLMTAIGAYGFQLSWTTWAGILVAAAVMFVLWRTFLAAKHS
ncbi:MAG: VTT domain-containing protein [Chloroflexota bacterium]